MNIKRLIFIGFVIVSLLVIHGLASSIYDLWHKQDLIKSQNSSLERNLAENRELKAKLKHVQTQEFIEEEARNKLFLSKPGEKEILLPSSTSAPSTHTVYISNWQKWVQLFLPNL